MLEPKEPNISITTFVLFNLFKSVNENYYAVESFSTIDLPNRQGKKEKQKQSLLFQLFEMMIPK